MRSSIRLLLVIALASCGGSSATSNDGAGGSGGDSSSGGSGGKSSQGGSGGNGGNGGKGGSGGSKPNSGGSTGTTGGSGGSAGSTGGAGGQASSTGGAAGTAAGGGGAAGAMPSNGKLITEGIDGPAPAQGCLTFKAKVFDFQSSHPDFQHSVNGNSVVKFVQEFLGADGNPVFMEAAGSNVKSAESFGQWFKSVPNVNMSVDVTLTAVTTGARIAIAGQPDATGTAFPFYPIDGKGFGNVDIVAPDTYASTGANEVEDKAHNQLFTTKIEAQFYYQGGKGELISVLSDDDSWVFVNGKLAPKADLGGVHGIQAQAGTVLLDGLKDSHGLKPGKHYPITFFYADRLFGVANYSLGASNMLFDCKP